MAKELPFFKFEPGEWLEGQIQICSDAAIVCFTNMMSGYWSKLGCISYAFALHKYCRRDASILQELIDSQIISVNNDEISIEFLDNQLVEFNDISEKRRKSARKRWSDANALQVDSKSNAIREEKRREEKIIKDKTITYSSEIRECYEKCIQFFPEHLRPKNQKVEADWLDTVEKLSRIDGIPLNTVVEIVKKTREDDFWSGNFLTLQKLRKKKDGIPYILIFSEKFKVSKNGEEARFIGELKKQYPNI